MVATDDTPLLRELRAIEQLLSETLALSRLLLAMRLLQDGHAKNLGEAARLAKDLDRVRELYPFEDD